MQAMEITRPALSVAAITGELGTHRFGRRVVYREMVNSTNDIARDLADAGEPEGTLVIADEQTAGRGRMARRWVAPARSSILMSLVLRPDLAPHQLARAVICLALGTCDAIRTVTGLDSTLKWPNDVLVNGKKCAGLLAEAKITGDQVEYVIAGLGLNMNFSVAAVPAIPPEATTIADELGRHLAREPLVRAILTESEPYYERMQAGENLRSEWAARLSTLHRQVRALTPGGEEVGVAESVDDDGALLVRRADGSTIALLAGDVTLVSRL